MERNLSVINFLIFTGKTPFNFHKLIITAHMCVKKHLDAFWNLSDNDHTFQRNIKYINKLEVW